LHRYELAEQVDLQREADNLDRFRAGFVSWRGVSFPAPLPGLVTPEVLVETYEEGVGIADFLAAQADNAAEDDVISNKEEDEDDLEGEEEELGLLPGDASYLAGTSLASRSSPAVRRELATLGVHALRKMLLEDNWLHADLHPRNILVLLSPADGSAWQSNNWWWPPSWRWPSWAGGRDSEPRLVFLDAGLATELTRGQRESVFRFFSAILRGNGAGVADCIVSIASHVPEKGFDIDAFRRDTGETMKLLAEEDLQAGSCMRLVFDVIRRHRISIEPHVVGLY
jgi:aarF domain-containing kinase